MVPIRRLTPRNPRPGIQEDQVWSAPHRTMALFTGGKDHALPRNKRSTLLPRSTQIAPIRPRTPRNPRPGIQEDQAWSAPHRTMALFIEPKHHPLRPDARRAGMQRRSQRTPIHPRTTRNPRPGIQEDQAWFAHQRTTALFTESKDHALPRNTRSTLLPRSTQIALIRPRTPRNPRPGIRNDQA